MGDDPVNNPTDDEAYEPGEVTRVRRDSVDDSGRRGLNRPGAPSAPPPPAESFRPAGPPPPADWFKPTGGRGAGGAGGRSGRGGADESIRPRRDAYGVDGPGSAGYTSQPGIPVERYPTPRPGEFPPPVPATRRTQPPQPPQPSQPSGGARGAQGRQGQDRPTEYLGRAGAGDAAGRSSGQGGGTSRPTERLGYGQYDDEAVDTGAHTEFGPASSGPQDQDAGGWQRGHENGGWRDAPGGYSAGAAGAAGGAGGKSGAGSVAADEKPPKRRRKRGRMIALIVVVVLLVLAIPADRFAAHIAVGVMRDKVELAVAE